MPRIQKMLILSTAHMSLRDSERLDANWERTRLKAMVVNPDVPFWAEKIEYGYLIFVDNDVLRNTDEPFSDAFVAAFRLAREMKVDWIRFDCDEEKTPDLPMEEW